MHADRASSPAQAPLPLTVLAIWAPASRSAGRAATPRRFAAGGPTTAPTALHRAADRPAPANEVDMPRAAPGRGRGPRLRGFHDARGARAPEGLVTHPWCSTVAYPSSTSRATAWWRVITPPPGGSRGCGGRSGLGAPPRPPGPGQARARAEDHPCDGGGWTSVTVRIPSREIRPEPPGRVSASTRGTMVSVDHCAVDRPAPCPLSTHGSPFLGSRPRRRLRREPFAGPLLERQRELSRWLAGPPLRVGRADETFLPTI